MTLQPAIDGALPFLRGEALARMTSRVTIRRKTGSTTWNQALGTETPEWLTVGADVPFRLGGVPRGASTTRTVTVAGTEVEVPVRYGNLPHDWADLADGDYLEVTAGENAAMVYLLVEASWQDQSTARRVPIVGVDRPEEW